VVEVAKPEGGLITYAEVARYAEELSDADLACLRTGWSAVRTEDPIRYASAGPALHPDAARFLVDECPTVRGVAVDAISIGSPGYPEETKLTHQVLTGVGRSDGRFILILEDLRVDPDLSEACRVYAWPLLIEGSDGSPCTIVAEFAG
jgi:kynurenine formamidase